jgi:FAD/FMN-containing dehydrogenase
MEDRDLTITLELHVAGDSLTGGAVNGAGPERKFFGRLGLLSAIELLLADSEARNQGGRMATIDTTRSPADTPRSAADTLRDRLAGDVVSPGDPGWDAARQAFNLTIDQRPTAVAFPVDETDVASVVAFARDHGLRIAPQSTGHNAGPIASLQDTVLLKTSAMTGVEIDPAARRARVRAGARWADVADPASELGLAPLAGSSRDVGVVGYSLGGGIGWLARRHGLQTNSVTAIELVTADGRHLRVDREHEPELFWALRGGGGNFGVVTAMEFDLYPAPEVYAGALFFPFERASEVLHAWREWLPSVPEDVTSVGRVLQVPDLPQVPDIVRGKSFALLEAAYLGDEATGAELTAPLRALGPDMDSFAMVPPAALGHLHMDPDEPSPYMSDTMLVGDLPASGIDDLVAVAGPGSGSPLVSVELRHMGGALARAEAHHGARSTLPGTFAMFAGGVPLDPSMASAIQAQLALVTNALSPWETGRYANFVEHPEEPGAFFDDDALRRLRAVKAAYDPADLFLANHPVN